MLRFFKYYISYLFIHYVLCFLLCHKLNQRVMKVVFDSPGLVDFAIGLENSVLNLPDGQVKCFEEFKLQKNCEINLLINTLLGLVEMMFGLMLASACSNNKL